MVPYKILIGIYQKICFSQTVANNELSSLRFPRKPPRDTAPTAAEGGLRLPARVPPAARGPHAAPAAAQAQPPPGAHRRVSLAPTARWNRQHRHGFEPHEVRKLTLVEVAPATGRATVRSRPRLHDRLQSEVAPRYRTDYGPKSPQPREILRPEVALLTGLTLIRSRPQLQERLRPEVAPASRKNSPQLKEIQDTIESSMNLCP